MKELKPCPFCGGRASIKEIKVYCEPKPYLEYGIQCEMCRCELKVGFSHVEVAVRAWNTRKDET